MTRFLICLLLATQAFAIGSGTARRIAKEETVAVEKAIAATDKQVMEMRVELSELRIQVLELKMMVRELLDQQKPDTTKVRK